ncbi:hypothetical protein G5V57_03040 [Nordella sp. HKS 07]|uniref:hypothetical protein n=1 Tax=Nordella sp. HKS 07 TaxID=2712222 RepID=UPI0013E1A78A|nr:hypothetical protein [Nordella sp. HKS 07]QIG46812.1 hypothetical protein G5V57_03040 [Nordella sp. HKS 07]
MKLIAGGHPFHPPPPAYRTSWLGRIYYWVWRLGVRLDGVTVEKLLARARDGDKSADNLVRGLAAHCLRERIAMPPCLSEYAADKMLESIHISEKARRLVENYPRDHMILNAVYRISKDFGIPATCSWNAGSSTPKSACAIVSAALARNSIHISEDGVKKIWNRKSKDFEKMKVVDTLMGINEIESS